MNAAVSAYIRCSVACACATAMPASADVIQVPPVTIHAINSVRDYESAENYTEFQHRVRIPNDAASYSGGDGFTASVGTGDTVVVRVQAPPGYLFRIKHEPLSAIQYFQVSMYWQTGESDTFDSTPSVSVEFVDGVGTAPVASDFLGVVSDNAAFIGAIGQFAVVGDFTFSAFEMRLTPTHPLAPLPRTYLPVTSSDGLSFGTNTRIPWEVLEVAPYFRLEPIVGACCVGGICTVMAAPDCTGEFLGANSACTAPGRGGRVFNACCPADFDGVPGLGVPDIFAYLSAWFAGCP